MDGDLDVYLLNNDFTLPVGSFRFLFRKNKGEQVS
jgi:hypothetical protein